MTLVLTDEQVRILRACRDGRLKLRQKPAWRWYIEGEVEHPSSHERKHLINRGLMRNVWDGERQNYHAELTERGIEAVGEVACPA